MDTITEEVVSESSQNSALTETQADGNITMAEFADQLLKSKQVVEEEPEAQAELTDEPAEEPAEPTEVDEEQSADDEVEVEDSSPPAEDSDVLSNKFNNSRRWDR